LASLLATLLDVPAHLVIVEDHDSSHTEGVRGRGAGHQSVTRDEKANAYLEGTAASLQALDIAISTEVRSGPAATGVMATLGTGDLLVITTHGQGAARRWQIGNVAEKLLRQAATPVALVRADVT
ncbi:MAG TPA: universal stress protein, partial [Thermomicrobiales bacterium]|nr:universal stress protein [Thermomicrobiales bacterium]